MRKLETERSFNDLSIMQLAGRRRNLEPVQNTGAVVSNMQSKAGTDLEIIKPINTRIPTDDDSLSLTRTYFTVLTFRKGTC